MSRHIGSIFAFRLVVLLVPACCPFFSVDGHAQNASARTNSRPDTSKRDQLADQQRADVAKLQAAIDSQNVPITFWGKVIDQDGQPLPGVRILMSVRKLQFAGATSGFESSFDQHTTFSGADGRFDLSDVRGGVLTIKSVEKEGYRVSPSALRSFGYNISTNHIPRFDHPVILQMWKRGNAEALLAQSKFFRVIPDGRLYTFDLLKVTHGEGRREGTDVELQIKRPNGVARSDRYDWEFRLAVPTGGIIETADASGYMAPATGYVKDFRTSVSLSDPVWRGSVKRSFFVTSRNGQIYGSLTLDVDAYYNGEAAVDLKYTVNPGGSRNLEPGGPQLSPLAQ
jgi:hypothetical protein